MTAMTREQRAEELFRRTVERIILKSPEVAREILSDGTETIGGGTRIARLTFDPATRSASIVMSDTAVLPFLMTVEIG